MTNTLNTVSLNGIQAREIDKKCWKPEILNPRNSGDRRRIVYLIKKGAEVLDEIGNQLLELIEVNNPQFLFLRQKLSNNKKIKDERWVFYPWRRLIVRCLKDDDFKAVRTSRNFGLLTKTEQKFLKTIKIGVAGLNVGNPGAIGLALEGVGGLYKLADIDPLSLSNLNRFRAGVCDLGVNKATLTARQIFELNPYAKVEVFEQGINQSTVDGFLSKPKLDILIEEMDNLNLKILVREKSRQLKIPVVMVTGNGENVIIDVERYDLDSNLSLLNGRLDNETVEKIKAGVGASGVSKLALARDFIGSKYLTKRLRDSFLQVGKTLAGIPQLAETSFLRGAVLCFVVRAVLTNNLNSGRYYLNLTDISKFKL